MESSATANSRDESLCDSVLPISSLERQDLMSRLEKTKIGQGLIRDFQERFGSLDALILQWDQVSFSQILQPSAVRSSVVCVHLAEHLPEIEHIADLAHEMTHATRLDPAVLLGYGIKNSDEFVRMRIAGVGGEADAFSMECALKREILNHWDHFCVPYVTGKNMFDVKKVVEDLYNGELSASLTGEPYPIMLSKQYANLQQTQLNLRNTRRPASLSRTRRK